MSGTCTVSKGISQPLSNCRILRYGKLNIMQRTGRSLKRKTYSAYMRTYITSACLRAPTDFDTLSFSVIFFDQRIAGGGRPARQRAALLSVPRSRYTQQAKERASRDGHQGVISWGSRLMVAGLECSRRRNAHYLHDSSLCAATKY